MDSEEYYRPANPKFHKNRLLVRSQIGTGKRCTIPLPPSEHRYGKVNDRTDESAGEIVLNWKGFVGNPDDVPPKDFVAMNRAATLAGCVTNSDVIKFRQTTTIRQNVGTNREPRAHGLSHKELQEVENRTHGRPPVQREAPMEKIIMNGFHKDWMSEQGARVKGAPSEPAEREACPWKRRETPSGGVRKMPIRQTRASRSHALMAKSKLKSQTNGSKGIPKSKKYANIRAKLAGHTRRTMFKPQVNAEVRAPWREAWLPAKVLAINGDNTYNVKFLEDNTYATVRRLRPAQ